MPRGIRDTSHYEHDRGIRLYRRYAWHERALGTAFFYAVHLVDANHVVWGFGYESLTGMQVKHIPVEHVHLIYAAERGHQIATAGLFLDTTKLAPYFHGGRYGLWGRDAWHVGMMIQEICPEKYHDDLYMLSLEQFTDHYAGIEPYRAIVDVIENEMNGRG